MTTFEVEFLYGTNIVLDPSLPFNPEFLRNNRLPCSFSCLRFFHQRCPPTPPAMMDDRSASVANNRVVLDVAFIRCRMSCA
jgi:hypothetical protein